MTAAPPLGKKAKKTAAALATPTGFSKGVLGHSIWSKQGEILDSVAVNRRTAVKSCHASGKTFLSADAVLWWVTTQKDAIAVTTAPTWLQVEKLLWGEIRRSAANARIAYPKISTTELKIGEGNYAIGLSTNDSDRFQGFHAKRVLIVLDEAPGVRQEIWNGIQGLRAGGNVCLLAIGNPVEPSGTFYDAFTSQRAAWQTFTISAFDTPNLARVYLEYDETDEQNRTKTIRVGHPKAFLNLLELTEDELDASTRPYLCSRRWVKEMFVEWGPNHPYFLSRVLGEFPMETDDMLIPLSWLEKLKNLSLENPGIGAGPVRAGIDVAGPGEAETVLVLTQGGRVIKIKAWPNADPRGEIVAALMPYKDVLEVINVDSIGIGWGIFLHLCDIKEFGGKQDAFGKGLVVPINVGQPSQEPKKFANSKAEYFWNLRLEAKDGNLLGITDEKTIGQLATMHYRHNPRGLIEIESKEDLAKRGVKSPDRAEAVMLASARKKHKELFSIVSMTKSEGPGSGNTLVQPSKWKMDGGSSLGTRWSNS